MELQELMERIQLPKLAQKVVIEYSLADEEYQKWRELFYKDTKEFLMQWKESESHLQLGMVFYLRLACEVYEEYRKQKIEDKIFDDTFYDITIWAEECYRKYGCWGIEEAGWLSVSAKMKLFRLGRLQFEPVTLKENLEGSPLKAGTKVLNVHIPAGEKLDYEACRESVKRAEVFFEDIYEAYICDSWLLSPKLRDILPETSNIIRFQKMFEIVKVHYTFPQAEQRIFQDIREDKENYPEDTLLRRKAKEYICCGNNIGIGIGYFYK
ncbi:MAG: acyltransferase domain-containing protein [Lachnospiraceae bacterium]